MKNQQVSKLRALQVSLAKKRDSDWSSLNKMSSINMLALDYDDFQALIFGGVQVQRMLEFKELRIQVSEEMVQASDENVRTIGTAAHSSTYTANGILIQEFFACMQVEKKFNFWAMWYHAALTQMLREGGMLRFPGHNKVKSWLDQLARQRTTFPSLHLFVAGRTTRTVEITEPRDRRPGLLPSYPYPGTLTQLSCEVEWEYIPSLKAFVSGETLMESFLVEDDLQVEWTFAKDNFDSWEGILETRLEASFTVTTKDFARYKITEKGAKIRLFKNEEPDSLPWTKFKHGAPWKRFQLE